MAVTVISAARDEGKFVSNAERGKGTGDKGHGKD